MGIDAEMLVRYRGEKPTDTQLARWSWELCAAIGPDNFFVRDGLRGPEYKAAKAAWHEAFLAHPEAAALEVMGLDGKQELHRRILADIGQPPQLLRRAIRLAGDTEYADAAEEVGRIYRQDGDPIVAEPGEWLLELSLWTRYYGPGYERGDILTICSIAEWCEANLQPCAVWYGGDSSGVVASLFDDGARRAMKAHLFGPSGRDYFNLFGHALSSPGDRLALPDLCGLCIPEEPRFVRNGFGQNFASVSCAGCAKRFESRDNGATWTLCAKES